jgi:hypothetical protein
MDYKIVRRMARAALEQAVRDAGIPLDYFVFPHQDHPKELWVIGEKEVWWMHDDNHTVRAKVYFDDGYAGAVVGEQVYEIVNSREFYPEDYGLDSRLPFDLKFDITDLATRESSAWESLPLAKLRKQPRVHAPTVVL